MAQKARKSVPNGSERQKWGKWWWIERKIDMRTLSVELNPPLETLNNNNNNNNNHKQIMVLNADEDVALNVEMNDMQWLWTPNEEVDSNAERRYSSVCQTKQDTALNAEIKISNGSECQNETKQDAKCWNEWRSGFERQMKKWIWTPSENVAPNTKRSETWLWTPKQR